MAGQLTAGQRSCELDRLRGAAVLLMLLDHALAAGGVLIVPAGLGWFRCTLTRISCPLFFLVAGALWSVKLPRPSRLAVAFGLGVVLTYSTSYVVGLHFDILVQYAAIGCFAGLIVGAPAWAVVLGFAQAAFLPLKLPAYEFGFLFGFAGVGVLCARSAALPDLPPLAVLETVGRRPLAWYVGHWIFLIALSAAVRYA